MKESCFIDLFKPKLNRMFKICTWIFYAYIVVYLRTLRIHCGLFTYITVRYITLRRNCYDAYAILIASS